MASPALPFCTYRVHSSCPGFDKATLRSVIPLEDGEQIINTSLALDPYKPRTSARVGTITWNTVPHHIRQLSPRDSDTLTINTSSAHPEGALEQPTDLSVTSIDSHFTGLTPLNSGSDGDDGSVIIIAITGVGGRPFMSWQHQSGGMWLRDFLPRDIPKVRVFTYGYPSKLSESDSFARLADYTDAFLHELEGFRLGNNLGLQPIILVGHSFGGLIIKNALINMVERIEHYGNLFMSIYSVIFLGVPHRGLNTAALEEMVAKETTRELVAELKESSTLMRSLSERFVRASKSLKILTCWELEGTPTMETRDGVYRRTGPSQVMVNESSARLFLPNEDCIPIKANHSMMAKLADDAGSEYHRIKDCLSRHATFAPEVVTRRFVKQQCASALSEVHALAGFVYTLVGLVKGQEVDVTTFEKILVDEMSFLEAFAGFLVDDELSEILDDQKLSRNWPRHIQSLLEMLKDTFSSFTVLAMQFHEPYRRAVRQALAFKESEEPLRSKNKNLDTMNQDLLRHLSMNKRLVDAKSLNIIMQQCQRATAGLRQAIAFATLCSMRFGTQADLEYFQAKQEIQRTHLAPVIRQQYLLQSELVQEAEPLKGRLEEDETYGVDPDLLAMKFFQVGVLNVETVVVEYRYYEEEPRLERSGRSAAASEMVCRDFPRVKSLMRKLAGLLHQLSSVNRDRDLAPSGRSSCGVNCLAFLGFLEQPEHSRFAFLFKIPEEIPAPKLSEVQSFASFIGSPISQEAIQRFIPLEQKFRLAYKLCDAVLNLHACGWVHKDIRSAHVLVVPTTTTSMDLSVHKCPPELALYLKGFEIARPEQSPSSARANFDPVANIYRHPLRQNAPMEGFRKEHDIYALGVVLLEIGMWKTIPSLLKDQIDRARRADFRFWAEPKMLKAKLMAWVDMLLPRMMGTRYAEAVRKCLDGDFGVVQDDPQQTRLGLELRKQVLDDLEAGYQALGKR